MSTKQSGLRPKRESLVVSLTPSTFIVTVTLSSWTHSMRRVQWASGCCFCWPQSSGQCRPSKVTARVIGSPVFSDDVKLDVLCLVCRLREKCKEVQAAEGWCFGEDCPRKAKCQRGMALAGNYKITHLAH